MNYELAKQLKDKGFPQKSYVGASFYVNGSLNITLVMGIQEKSYWENEVYAPTLSELIDACGDDFSGLYTTNDGYAAYTGIHSNEQDGSTPEEAVAKLWLAIKGV